MSTSITHTGQDSVVEAVAEAPQEDIAIKAMDTKEVVVRETTVLADMDIKAVVPLAMLETNPITMEYGTKTI